MLVEVFNVVIEDAANVFVVLDMVFEVVDICEPVDVSRVVKKCTGKIWSRVHTSIRDGAI